MATQRRRLDIKADSDLVRELDALKPKLGTHARTQTIRALVRLADNGDLPPATFEVVFSDARPCLIVGPSGSGKTTTGKSFLEHWPGPALVIDPSAEYDFPSIGYSQVSAIDWTKNGKFSCKLSKDVTVSKIEASLVFRQLNLIRADGALKPWLILIEESHRFEADPELQSLILEARKNIGKVLILTARPEPFAKLAPAFAPGLWARQHDGEDNLPHFTS